MGCVGVGTPTQALAEAQTYLIVALEGHTFTIELVVTLLPHRGGA